jgi:hypothetical protein
MTISGSQPRWASVGEVSGYAKVAKEDGAVVVELLASVSSHALSVYYKWLPAG